MQCDVFYVVCVFSTSFVNLLQTNGRLTDIVRSFQTLMPSLHLLGKVRSHVTPPPVGEQSIAMSVSVSVCLFVSLCLLSISQKPDVQTLPNLDACCLWPWSCVLTALQSINQSISAVRYVLRVSWNTSFCARDRPGKGCSSSAYTQSDSPGGSIGPAAKLMSTIALSLKCVIRRTWKQQQRDMLTSGGGVIIYRPLSFIVKFVVDWFARWHNKTGPL